ncbi:MAG: hypothetical protein QOJ42_1575, partial [Acidobacteriaceae bacterium]|nr:hypothetical protein [Acidobacteriaceae bacterium]
KNCNCKKLLNQHGQERKMKRHAKNLGISPSVPQYAHVRHHQHGELASDYQLSLKLLF